MNLERLRWGEWIAAIAGLDLLLVTFRAWYKVSGSGAHVTAWDALDNGRYLLIATAIAGIFLWLLKASEETQQLRFPPGWIAAVVGLVCTVYVAYRLATPPADNLDPDVALFLGLISALGVAIGGLLSAREPDAAPDYARTQEGQAAGDDFGAPAMPEPVGAAAGAQSWSPAAPAASSSGWSPAAPAAALPAATAAGAFGDAERPLRSGDPVVLTAGGARFPAGTVAEVVEVFAGGALVEVKAPDGMAERFEVPESAYERPSAGGAGGGASAADSWQPAMPAAASDDWGFDEPGVHEGGAATADEARAEGPKTEKVPWWKREIGGGKKKKGDEDAGIGAAGALAAGAAGAAVAHEATSNGSGEAKPGFFKRLFGGGAKDEPATERLEDEPTPASDVAGIGQAAESDTAVDESTAESRPDEDTGTETAAAASAADVAVTEPEPDTAPEPEAAPEPAASAVDPDPPAPAEPDPPAPAEPAAASSAGPEPAASAPEPESVVDPEPPAAPEPEVVASEEHAPGVPAADPAPAPGASEPSDSEPSDSAPSDSAPAGAPTASEPAVVADGEPAASAADEPEAEAAGAAHEDDVAPTPTPKRKRSSGSREVPKEVLAAAGDDQPKVGDEVQLKVGGGRFDAGTRGTVVDVFSAGVIVELSDDKGRTERLDLPFEAISPADA